MTEPLSVRIRQCTSPVEAIALMATEIDALRAQLAAPAADPWAQPLQWGVPVELPASAPTPPTDRIQALEAKLAETTDPEDIQALEAQLRLAREAHIKLDSPAVPAMEDESGIVEVPAPTPERIAERMQYANEHRFIDYLMNAEAVKMGGQTAEAEWLAWFGRVGPKGLYVHDRLCIMKMPIDCRRWLVTDMVKDDEAYALNMSADILKSEEGMSQEMAEEMLKPTWAS